MADALRRAKSFSRSDIHDALLATNMDTIFGPVKFETFEGYTNQNSGLKNGQVVLSQWQNRRLYNVWPTDSAEAKPTYPGTYK
jgi:branched-chain amino acid transport system substrate-binding protein